MIFSLKLKRSAGSCFPSLEDALRVRQEIRDGVEPMRDDVPFDRLFDGLKDLEFAAAAANQANVGRYIDTRPKFADLSNNLLS